ncbi:hypothetical protein [Streptomyces candidus]|uniref:CBS domain containing-hemolysin-like protein n=1 Tax=Streptomyces candidus TaxID=67283 RepID=A0A7X0LQ42_9ACTN|nr:CBS domain containing-hemolysin-like protein [Streptomyces candidus]GHH43645.1 hypothetical protein GCM10018773_30120 [Streptomyces candidus]
MVRDSSDADLLSPAGGERPRDALELGTRPVGGIFVPAPDMVAVDRTVTPARLERIDAAAGFSRFPTRPTRPTGADLGHFHIKDALDVVERHPPSRIAPHEVTRETARPDRLTPERRAADPRLLGPGPSVPAGPSSSPTPL